MPTEKTFLIADIGGTNTRAALKTPGMPAAQIQVFKNAEFPSLGALLCGYLERAKSPRTIDGGALAVASPVENDRITLTNLDWTFSTEALRRELGLETLRIFNDFTAIALSLPALDDDGLEKIGGGKGLTGEARAVLGPGTGLGVSGLVRCNNSWTPLAAEGGHATLATETEEESRLVELLRPRLKQHVSVEKLLSGPGLVQLYYGLAELRGEIVETLEAESITTRALDAGDPLAVDTLQMFLALLGGHAGNIALTLGARGGVYLAGGILPTMIDAVRQSSFMERFTAKGRLRNYLEAIPVCVITDPQPGLAGLEAWVEASVGASS